MPDEPKVEIEPTAEVVETDTDLDKELADLEAGKVKVEPTTAPVRTELEKATFSFKSNLKRVKELGGDLTSLLEDELPARPEATPIDTSGFVTKKDLAHSDAQKIAKSPSELKLMIWWMDNRGMSVEDAHFMANKNRIKKTLGEVGRSEGLIPAAPGGGAGQRPADKPEGPADLPEADKRKLIQSGMIYDPAKMAYIGKKVQYKYDPVTKSWATLKL